MASLIRAVSTGSLFPAAMIVASASLTTSSECSRLALTAGAADAIPDRRTIAAAARTLYRKVNPRDFVPALIRIGFPSDGASRHRYRMPEALSTPYRISDDAVPQ